MLNNNLAFNLSFWRTTASAYLLLLLVFAGISEFSEWASADAPPYALEFLIFLLDFSPLTGAAGIAYMTLSKAQDRHFNKVIVLILHSILFCIGFIFWLWWIL